MKRNQFTKKVISVAASAAIVLSAVQMCVIPVSAEDTSYTSGSAIQNGSFEAPSIPEVAKNETTTEETNSGNSISYRDSGWMVTSEDTFNRVSDNNFYWHTTASDNRIELVYANETGTNYFPSASDTSYHGDQFAELVAEEESSLYQNIATEPGKTLTWSISHRARVSKTGLEKNSMAVFIGPEQEGLKKKSSTGNDIFKQMAMLLYANFDTLEVGRSERAVKLYSVPVTDNMDITADSVSKEKSDKYSQEWFCWIITSDTKQWYEYSDTYEVPDGQVNTTLAFSALNGDRDGQDYINAGNLIDDVRFGVMHQLNVSAMSGGKGVVKYFNDDLESNDEVSVENSPYIKNLEENTPVTVSIEPDEGYSFVGALIDGEVRYPDDADDAGKRVFYDNNDGTYIYSTTMDQSHHIVLFFAQKGKVTYDPNFGTFSGAAADSGSVEPVDGIYGQKLYDAPANIWSLKQTAEPVNSGKTFVGWRVIADGSINHIDGDEVTTYTGELIPAGHTVEYDVEVGVDGTKTYIITYIDESGSEKTIRAEVPDGTILFLAVYYNTLTVEPCYVGVDGNIEHGDSAGGTATVSTNDGQNGTTAELYAGQEYTLTATPKTGYEFKGWYLQNSDDENDTSVIPDVGTPYTANFSSNRDVIIHARFVEIEVNPKVAVIAEDADAKLILNDEGITNTITNFTDGYGGDVYGNTISTCFDITRDFGEMSGDIGGVWTIYIPTNGTFMKVPDGDNKFNYLYLDFDNGKVVEDTKDVQNNKGTIYATKQNGQHGETEKFEFYVHSNTTVTGGSAVFGIVIDNVYAPNATAGFKVASSNSENVGELGEGNSIYTDYSKNDYNHDESVLNSSNTLSE